MTQLEAHEVHLAKIFSSDYDFVIPEYQRPYSWRPEQASQLLEDLSESLDRDDNEPYFLGSIVLVQAKNEPLAQVIDGQQRLTTLTILLAVLRDLSTDEELVNDFSKMIIEPGNKLLGLKPKPRLMIRPRDAEFFASHIQANGATTRLPELPEAALTNDPRRNLRDNSRALRDVLASWPEERRLALSTLLLTRTYLVVVRTADLESAHRIFSVMNARGLDLSPADIFKARVIGALPDGKGDLYADKWDNAEESLGRQAFADLFLHIRMIFARVRAERELLKEFPEQVLDAYLPDRAAAFVDDVVIPYADAFRVVRSQSYSAPEGAEKVNDWLRRLSLTDNNDWVPAALWAIRHHGYEPMWLDAFFTKLERLAANMLIRRVYSTPRATRYANVLRGLEAGQGLETEAFELTRDEIHEARAVLDGAIYLIPPVRRYVLLRLDEILANEPGVIFNHKIITVEHVLPQNPAADSQWSRVFSTEERDEWTHKLANLVLLNRRKNSEAQNFDFDVKKAKYFAGDKGVSIFASTSQVLASVEWSPSTLRARQDQLLAALHATWSL